MAIKSVLTSPALPVRRRVRAFVGALGLSLLAISAMQCGHDVIDLGIPQVRDAGMDAPGDSAQDSSTKATPEVVCTSNDDCTSVGGVCAVDQGRCVECTDNTQCPKWRAFCDTTSNECVQCLETSHCPSGLSCDPQFFYCVLPCTTDENCFGPVPICDEVRGACVQCETNAQCETQPLIGSVSHICSFGACVQCVDDSDCPFSTPYCLEGGRCVECFQSSQCGFGYDCNLFEGRCQMATQ